jgi:hypothetical protein
MTVKHKNWHGPRIATISHSTTFSDDHTSWNLTNKSDSVVEKDSIPEP